MKAAQSTLLTSAVLFTLFIAAMGQTGGPGQHGRRYDPKTEITVKGTVEEVQQYTGRQGWHSGIHLTLKAGADTLDVHVGPSSYVAQKQFSFAKGDSVEVIGSKTTMAGAEVLLAREITKDGKTLVLRDAQGVPQWAGGRRAN